MFESMSQAVEVLERLPKSREMLDPRTSRKMDMASVYESSYQERPSASALLRLYQIANTWAETEREYFATIVACERALEAARLSDRHKEILRRGYRAAMQFARAYGKGLDRYKRLHSFSVFAEKKLHEFADWMPSHTPHLHAELKDAAEEKGGIILYRGDIFDLRFQPNVASREVKRLVRQVKVGDMKNLDRLCEIPEDFINFAIEQLKRDEEKTARMTIGMLKRGLTALRRGKLTEEFEFYLQTILAPNAYRLKQDLLSSNGNYFSENSSERLFASFHHHPDGDKPSSRDIDATWRAGPGIVFSPANSSLYMYFMSRGRSKLVGRYPVE